MKKSKVLKKYKQAVEISGAANLCCLVLVMIQLLGAGSIISQPVPRSPLALPVTSICPIYRRRSYIVQVLGEIRCGLLHT